jgi:hypothetical protein
MRASLLFYRKLRKELENYGFEINLYDPCVTNKMTTSGKQMTLVWHVNDLMASCDYDFELTKLSCYLAKIYGPKLTMHTGRKHDYLGVDMEFRQDGTLGVSMIPYLKNVIAEFPELISGKSPTPAAGHLFKIRDAKDTKPLVRRTRSLWRRRGHWPSIIRWRNCCSWPREPGGTNKLRWLSSPHE